MLFITPRCTMIPVLLLLTLAHVPCVSSAGTAVHSDAGHDVVAISQGINNTDPLGVTEQLGNLVAVDAVFRDEDGTPIRIGDVLTIPTLLLPVYYGCPNVCSLMQSNIAQLLPRVDLKPGKEYQVISLSFDDTETPAMARQAKKDYLSAAGENWPPVAWRFLTGDSANIRRMMGSVGFHFQRSQDQFVHPVVMVVLAPGGKIVRYLYGYKPLPFDITMGMTEANEGRAGLSIKRALAYCFSYDPQGKHYALNILRVTGIAVVGLAIILFLALTFGGRGKKKAQE
jgi:protein SCO1